ncbi:MAG: Ig-like domain-containing protein [Prevotellaceae bacterium]|nr:Ig-like domain-containing protein [Candidatus Minthosoma equi]
MKQPHSSLLKFHYSLLAAMLLALLLVACANIGAPDGGPFDETPPKIVRTSPKFGEANSKNVKKIVIEFDEIIKIENAQEKVIVSPPQIEQPEIEASGKKVTVTLLDSLIPNSTYTIDFADAIVDNNEGNPYGDYAFTFSTGERVDTFQVSGNVLQAENLEPIKGILVGLYKVSDDVESDSVRELPDSTFRTIPFERISRTDSRGHFVVKGLSPGKYRAFALQDQNQNYVYDQRSEQIAFSDRILTTFSKPDVRQDTIWHDSIHYLSIDTVNYTHYYPDDIVLMAFASAKQDRFKLKEERPILQRFTVVFTAGSDTLPKITGLNFNSENAFIVDASLKKDTLNYWIKDSLIYNLDTLEMQMDYYATDTLGNLSLTTDTLYLVSKLTKEKMAKDQKEKFEQWAKEYRQKVKDERRAAKRAAEKKDDDDEDEDAPKTIALSNDSIAIPNDSIALSNDSIAIPNDSLSQDDTVPEIEEDGKSSKKKKKKKKDEDDDIVVPPMPEEFMDINIGGNNLDPDKNIDFSFPEPLDSIDMEKIHFSIKVDSLYEPAKFLFKQVPGNILKYRLYAEWEADTMYQLSIDTAAFVSIYGKRSDAIKRSIKLPSLDTYSTLFVTLHGVDTTAIVQLLDGSDKPVKSIKSQNGKADFYFLKPGSYYMRLFCDTNGNGEWDPGDYDDKIQPEEVYYNSKAFTLKANWEYTEDWSPKSTPLPKQKPAKITKQKPDKEKTVKNKNAERLKNKGKANNKSNSNNNSNYNNNY